MPYLNHNGVHLYYEDLGQGVPILLTHGFAAATGMWRSQIDVFQLEWHVIHGREHSQCDKNRHCQRQTRGQCRTA